MYSMYIIYISCARPCASALPCASPGKSYKNCTPKNRNAGSIKILSTGVLLDSQVLSPFFGPVVAMINGVAFSINFQSLHFKNRPGPFAYLRTTGNTFSCNVLEVCLFKSSVSTVQNNRFFLNRASWCFKTNLAALLELPKDTSKHTPRTPNKWVLYKQQNIHDKSRRIKRKTYQHPSKIFKGCLSEAWKAPPPKKKKSPVETAPRHMGVMVDQLSEIYTNIVDQQPTFATFLSERYLLLRPSASLLGSHTLGPEAFPLPTSSMRWCNFKAEQQRRRDQHGGKNVKKEKK